MSVSMAAPDIGLDEMKAVSDVLESKIIAAGPRVREFEGEFASYIGAKYGIAVSSGTAALHIALLAHGIGRGDEVITSPFTFIASANSVLFTGAKPVFADIDAKTFNMDPDFVRKCITEKTKAIMPVHLYGQACRMDELMEIADEHGLCIIEDACQAHGARFGKRRVGSFGTGCFSFYPTKNMTTSEGGMITSNDEDIDVLCRALRQHGMKKPYMHEMLGYNQRMTDIAAAIGLAQLKKLDIYNQKRQKNAKALTEGIKNDKVVTPGISDDIEHVFHQYTVLCQSREEAKKALERQDIGYGVYYPLPIHKQPYYLSLGYDTECEVSDRVSRHCLSLPVHPGVEDDDIGLICDTLNGL